MAKRIAISFKENKRDEKLLSIVKSKHDQSAYIKDAIEAFEAKNKPAAQYNDDDDIMLDVIRE
jgi:hypothetical protein